MTISNALNQQCCDLLPVEEKHDAVEEEIADLTQSEKVILILLHGSFLKISDVPKAAAKSKSGIPKVTCLQAAAIFWIIRRKDPAIWSIFASKLVQTKQNLIGWN